MVIEFHARAGNQHNAYVGMSDVGENNGRELQPGEPFTLNFAAASGVDVGNFITGAPVDQAGSYEKLRITMDNVFRILCSVSCNGTTYVTKGSSSASSPDGTGDASVSPLNINPDGPQSFTLTLSQPIQVASGVASEANIGFSATAACALWDISGVNGNPANSFKILPAVQSPNNAP